MCQVWCCDAHGCSFPDRSPRAAPDDAVRASGSACRKRRAISPVASIASTGSGPHGVMLTCRQPSAQIGQEELHDIVDGAVWRVLLEASERHTVEAFQLWSDEPGGMRPVVTETDPQLDSVVGYLGRRRIDRSPRRCRLREHPQRLGVTPSRAPDAEPAVGEAPCAPQCRIGSTAHVGGNGRIGYRHDASRLEREELAVVTHGVAAKQPQNDLQ